MKSFFVRWFMYRLVETVVNLNFHYADQVSPVCAFNARWEKRMGVPEERIDVIFNGVDPKKFQRVEREPCDHPVVSTVGLIYQLKGQLDLIDATGLLKPKFPDVEVRFYGTASDLKYFEACKKKVTDQQLEKNINFAGSTKEPWKVYSNADVVAFSSISEGFPYVVVEAMLCGAAIIATDVGGVREALGEAGILVPAKCPQQMADAIAFLLGNEDERKKLGRMAQARALEYFTEETFLNNYENTYRKLATRQPQKLLRGYTA
jgi:glycosyltransferase involved in cell wall biosynthesis